VAVCAQVLGLWAETGVVTPLAVVRLSADMAYGSAALLLFLCVAGGFVLEW
jgi:hypothetical protein